MFFGREDDGVGFRLRTRVDLITLRKVVREDRKFTKTVYGFGRKCDDDVLGKTSHRSVSEGKNFRRLSRGYECRNRNWKIHIIGW